MFPKTSAVCLWQEGTWGDTYHLFFPLDRLSNVSVVDTIWELASFNLDHPYVPKALEKKEKKSKQSFKKITLQFKIML